MTRDDWWGLESSRVVTKVEEKNRDRRGSQCQSKTAKSMFPCESPPTLPWTPPTLSPTIKLAVIAQRCEDENRNELVRKHHLNNIFLLKIGQAQWKLQFIVS